VIEGPAVLEILEILDRVNIQYMISGSVASMFYGEPRLTHDIDLVIDINIRSAKALYEKAKDDYYISMEGVRDALENKTIFNLIHNETGFKIDFWILTESEFDISRFGRRRKHRIEGKDYYFSTPEDTILIKLLWLKESGFKKHQDDISGLLRFFPGKLDYLYIWNWIEKLGLRREAGLVNLQGR